MTPTQSDVSYFANLKPRKAPLVWGYRGTCTNGILPGDEGCGLPVRWCYMRGSTVLPRFAMCPVCGRRYYFTFWKLRADPNYRPSQAQEADVRALYADLRHMARGWRKGKDHAPHYDLPLHQRIIIHCGAPVVWRLSAGLCARLRGA